MRLKRHFTKLLPNSHTFTLQKVYIHKTCYVKNKNAFLTLNFLLTQHIFVTNQYE